MRKFQNLGVVLVSLLPILYAAGYFGFLAWAKPRFQKEFTPFAKSVSVVTLNRPVANIGVALFKPAMAAHAKVSGARISVRTSEFG